MLIPKISTFLFEDYCKTSFSLLRSSVLCVTLTSTAAVMSDDRASGRRSSHSLPISSPGPTKVKTENGPGTGVAQADGKLRHTEETYPRSPSPFQAQSW